MSIAALMQRLAEVPRFPHQGTVREPRKALQINAVPQVPRVPPQKQER